MTCLKDMLKVFRYSIFICYATPDSKGKKVLFARQIKNVHQHGDPVGTNNKLMKELSFIRVGEWVVRYG